MPVLTNSNIRGSICLRSSKQVHVSIYSLNEKHVHVSIYSVIEIKKEKLILLRYFHASVESNSRRGKANSTTGAPA